MTYTPYRTVEAGLGGLAAGQRRGVWDLRARWRDRVLPGLAGDVLDVGAGDGGLVRALPGTARVILLEPHRSAVRSLERRFGRRRDVRVLAAPAERIPLPAAAVDVAVCSAVLCSVADQDRALAEIFRVLRPGGRLVLLEHVAAEPGSWLRRGQRFLAPLSRLLDRGCDPARDTEAAIARSAFDVADLCRVDATGPFGLRIPHLAAVLVRPDPTKETSE